MVFSPPLWKIWVRQLGWLEIPNIWENAKLMATSHHQPEWVSTKHAGASPSQGHRILIWSTMVIPLHCHDSPRWKQLEQRVNSPFSDTPIWIYNMISFSGGFSSINSYKHINHPWNTFKSSHKCPLIVLDPQISYNVGPPTCKLIYKSHWLYF